MAVRAAATPRGAAVPTDYLRAAVATNLARGALAAVAVGVLALIALHLAPHGRQLNPMSVPLSRYAVHGEARLFDFAVGALAAALAALLCGLVLRGHIRKLSPAAFAIAASCVGLVGVVVFPDTTVRNQLTPIGWVHWAAAMLAFGCLPVGTLAIKAASGHGRPRSLLLARVLACAALCWLAGYLVGSIIEQLRLLPIWRIGGLAERGMTATEIAIAPMLARLVWRSGALGEHGAAAERDPLRLPERMCPSERRFLRRATRGGAGPSATSEVRGRYRPATCRPLRTRPSPQHPG